MANTSISSDDSIAPRDFYLSTSTDSNSRLSPIRQKCPLCHNFRNEFYCKNCIYSGLFYDSRHRVTEGYIDKQKALLELKDSKKILEAHCLSSLETKQKCVALNSEIRRVREKTKFLKSALEYKKQKKLVTQARYQEMRKINESNKIYLPKYDIKVQESENSLAVYREKVQKTREILKDKQKALKKLVKIRIQQLFKYIFPIHKIKPTYMERESSSDDMVNALAEASQTTSLEDEWAYSEYMKEIKYCIVGPTLPVSGKYSSYNIWVAKTQDEVPGTNTNSSVSLNPAISISAALTYTAQLVSILSFYSDIKLPHKMQYSDFCISHMNAQQFVRRTARLNANIIYLCLLQNVDIRRLIPNQTIHNILLLLKGDCDLGRDGPMVYEFYFECLEGPMNRFLDICEDSDSDDGDSFPVEWEAVPHMQCPEIGAGPAIGQAYPMMSTQQTGSLAGGLVNSAAASIASLWRGFTGR